MPTLQPFLLNLNLIPMDPSQIDFHKPSSFEIDKIDPSKAIRIFVHSSHIQRRPKDSVGL